MLSERALAAQRGQHLRVLQIREMSFSKQPSQTDFFPIVRFSLPFAHIAVSDFFGANAIHVNANV